MATLLVVEDEPHIASGLRFNLEAEGHGVRVVDSGEEALQALADDSRPIDCMVLDVMLPGLDGFKVASTARERGWFHPILMLTARARPEDVLKGFEAGADDYLPKPFELSILVARVNALLRRRAWQAAPRDAAPGGAETYEFGGFVADFTSQELRRDQEIHHLTLMEANLLRYLLQREGQAVSRKNMLEDVWNLRVDTDTRAIDHFIARLRKYIEKEPGKPRHLLTVRGVGYKFVARPR